MRAVPVFHFPPDASLAGLGLTTDPFPPGPEDGYFFSTPALAGQIERLHDLVQHGDGLLVVIGAAGAGKTCMLEQLVAAAGQDWRIGRVQGAPDTTPDELVAELMESLALPPRSGDRAAPLDLLQAHLEASDPGRQVTLIAVDDAHRLPENTLAFLVDLARRPAAFKARILLAGMPGALAVADAATGAPHPVHVIELMPFSRAQTGEYLQARLEQAGFVGEGPFSDDTVSHIHRSTGGIPGAMHPLATQALASRARGRRGIGAGRSRGVGMILGLVLVGAGIGVLLSRFSGGLDAGSGVSAPLPQAGPAGASTSVTSAIPAGASTGPTAGGPSRPATGTVSAPAEASRSPGALPGSARVDVGTSSDAGESVVTVYPLDGPSPSSVVSHSTMREPAGPSRGSPPHAGPTGPGTPSTTRAALGTALAGNVSIASAAFRQGAAGTSQTYLPEGVHDLTWLEAQEDSSYVIQLLGTREKAALETFIHENGLGAQAAWFTTVHQGGPWYVLVYGLYPSRESARAAAAELPARLSARSPWARSIASIKESAR